MRGEGSRRLKREDLTLSLSLPCEYEDPVDVLPGPQVHHEHRLVHVVVVHDGAVGQVGALLTVHRQGAVPVLPLLPRVPLVVDPGAALVRLVGDTARLGVNPQES